MITLNPIPPILTPPKQLTINDVPVGRFFLYQYNNELGLRLDGGRHVNFEGLVKGVATKGNPQSFFTSEFGHLPVKEILPEDITLSYPVQK